MTGQFARARLVSPTVQVVHVTVRDGYRPAAIAARAGVPLRLVFHRDEDATCSERVIFSSPHLDRHLAPHGRTIVELPAQGPGDVRFTCAMGRYRGLIRLTEEEAGRPSRHLQLRPVRIGIGVTGAVLVLAAGALVSAVVPAFGPLPLLAALVTLLAVTWVALGARVSGTYPPPR